MPADIVAVQVKRVFICINGSVIFIGDGKKTLFFFTGVFEGAILRHVLANKQSERPLTHKVWLDSLTKCGHEPTNAIITQIVRGTFFGELTFATDASYTGRDLVVDCRPSDLVILATLANIPIHVAQDVWDAMENHTDKVGLSDEDLVKVWPFSNFVNPPTIYVGVTPEEIEEMEADN